MKRILFKFILFFLLTAVSSAQNAVSETNGSAVTIRRTVTHKITSGINNVTYPIYIAFPASYESSNNDYPVIFQLDAYSSFGTLVQMQRLLLFNKEAPEAIIVGISSEGGSKEFNYNRSRDFTPTYISPDSIPASSRAMLPISGGAEKFLSFIKHELIPFIENKYRVKKDDYTLIGHSLGGLFCFYSIFSEPGLFHRYIILSPALFWDNEHVLELEKKYYETHSDLSAIVYSAIGGLEAQLFVEPWKKMIFKLKERNYKSFKVIDEIIPGETHYTMIPFMSTHGLKSVFGK